MTMLQEQANETTLTHADGHYIATVAAAAAAAKSAAATQPLAATVIRPFLGCRIEFAVGRRLVPCAQSRIVGWTTRCWRAWTFRGKSVNNKSDRVRQASLWRQIAARDNSDKGRRGDSSGGFRLGPAGELDQPPPSSFVAKYAYTV